MTKIILIAINLFPLWLFWLFISAVMGWYNYNLVDILNGYYWWWC